VASFRSPPPVWFRVTIIILVLWNLFGAYVCIQQFRLGAEAMGPATDYDRALYASMPVWYNWVFAFAEVTGVAGTIALLLRKAISRPLLILSLIGVIVQFGYLFLTSDIIAVKGIGTTYLPLFIAAVCILQVWLADLAIKRGWSH